MFVTPGLLPNTAALLYRIPAEQVRLDSRHPDLRIPPVPPGVFVDVHRSPPTYKLGCSEQVPSVGRSDAATRG